MLCDEFVGNTDVPNPDPTFSGPQLMSPDPCSALLTDSDTNILSFKCWIRIQIDFKC